MNKSIIWLLFIVLYAITKLSEIMKYTQYSYRDFLKELIVFFFYGYIFLFLKLISLYEGILLCLFFCFFITLEYIIKTFIYNCSKPKEIIYINLDNNNIAKDNIMDFCKSSYIKVKSIEITEKIQSPYILKKYDIIIISSNMYSDILEEILNLCSNTEIFLRLNSEIVCVVKDSITIIKDIPFVKIKNLRINGFDSLIKRNFDIIIASLLLIFLFPLIIIVSLCIKLDSPGPIFYIQERETINNKKFKLYKFRSMYLDSEKDGIPLIAQKNDDRITRVGKIIRELKIDEIPQLYNVIKGDMSIVGPRPERPFFIEKYQKLYKNYNYRHNIKAGITGLSHVFGNYYTEPQYRYIYDLYYILNYSLFLDLKILIKTVMVILHLK